MTLLERRSDSASAVSAPPKHRNGAGTSDDFGFLLDIQGLRMIAVTSVVVHHVFQWPDGGYVGVDMFFVISGFLITSLLLREGMRYGHVSIADFYRRRARRILPMALLVIGATVTASYVLVLASRFESIVVDSWWSAGFVMNWHLVSVGTDYFQSALPHSPLQHYWSLAVEEQFYVVWPLLMVGLLLIATRWRKNLPLRPLVAGFAVIAIAVSFLWAMNQSVASPTAAYFSTFSRVWQLAAGALLAAIAPVCLGTPAWLRSLMAVTGLVGITYSVLVVGAAIPAPSGAIPVIATCLVISAGIGSSGLAATRPLRLRPVVYLGTISYSLYLWHWPLAVLLLTVLDVGITYYVAAIIGTIALSIASYHLVEKAVLNSEFLAPRSRRRGHRPASSDGHDGQRVFVGALGAAMIFLLVALFNQPSVVLPDDGPTPVLAAAAVGQTQDPLEAAIRESLAAESFPATSPPLDDVESGMPIEMTPEAGCLNPPELRLDICNFGDSDAPQSAFVVGDSFAAAWLHPIAGALVPRGFRVHGMALGNCPFIASDVTIETAQEATDRCNSSRDAMVDQILTARPSMVVMIDMEIGIQRTVNSEGSVRAWTTARTDIIDRIAPSGAAVVILTPNPIGKAATECAGRLAVPSNCISTISDNWLKKRSADEAAAEQTGATFIDTRSWFCYRNTCPLFVSGIVVSWDTGHITRQYGEYLIPRIEEALLPA
ncbi:MAG: acyltransferase family protein [Rhodococcus sp. (in: high G+C Gram-positive bacteria)]